MKKSRNLFAELKEGIDELKADRTGSVEVRKVAVTKPATARKTTEKSKRTPQHK